MAAAPTPAHPHRAVLLQQQQDPASGVLRQASRLFGTPVGGAVAAGQPQAWAAGSVGVEGWRCFEGDGQRAVWTPSGSRWERHPVAAFTPGQRPGSTGWRGRRLPSTSIRSSPSSSSSFSSSPSPSPSFSASSSHGRGGRRHHRRHHHAQNHSGAASGSPWGVGAEGPGDNPPMAGRRRAPSSDPSHGHHRWAAAGSGAGAGAGAGHPAAAAAAAHQPRQATTALPDPVPEALKQAVRAQLPPAQAAEVRRIVLAQELAVMEGELHTRLREGELGAEAAREQEREVREVFAGIDLDGDGVLTRRELAALAERLIHRPLGTGQLDGLMAVMDADGSGSVDFEEFLHWWQHGGGGGGGGQQPATPPHQQQRHTGLAPAPDESDEGQALWQLLRGGHGGGGDALLHSEAFMEAASRIERQRRAVAEAEAVAAPLVREVRELLEQAGWYFRGSASASAAQPRGEGRQAGRAGRLPRTQQAVSGGRARREGGPLSLTSQLVLSPTPAAAPAAAATHVDDEEGRGHAEAGTLSTRSGWRNGTTTPVQQATVRAAAAGGAETPGPGSLGPAVSPAHVLGRDSSVRPHTASSAGVLGGEHSQGWGSAAAAVATSSAQPLRRTMQDPSRLRHRFGAARRCPHTPASASLSAPAAAAAAAQGRGHDEAAGAAGQQHRHRGAPSSRSVTCLPRAWSLVWPDHHISYSDPAPPPPSSHSGTLVVQPHTTVTWVAPDINIS
jgi:hypothetical protein